MCGVREQLVASVLSFTDVGSCVAMPPSAEPSRQPQYVSLSEYNTCQYIPKDILKAICMGFLTHKQSHYFCVTA